MYFGTFRRQVQVAAQVQTDPSLLRIKELILPKPSEPILLSGKDHVGSSDLRTTCLFMSMFDSRSTIAVFGVNTSASAGLSWN